jgi:hypothetical protein
MQGLVSDNALEQTSIAVDDILRLYCIKNRQSVRRQRAQPDLR